MAGLVQAETCQLTLKCSANLIPNCDQKFKTMNVSFSLFVLIMTSWNYPIWSLGVTCCGNWFSSFFMLWQIKNFSTGFAKTPSCWQSGQSMEQLLILESSSTLISSCVHNSDLRDNRVQISGASGIIANNPMQC